MSSDAKLAADLQQEVQGEAGLQALQGLRGSSPPIDAAVLLQAEHRSHDTTTPAHFLPTDSSH